VGGRGTSGTPFKTIECYDPLKNSWVQVIEMSTRRRHVGVVAVAGRSLGLSVCLSVCVFLSVDSAPSFKHSLLTVDVVSVCLSASFK